MRIISWLVLFHIAMCSVLSGADLVTLSPETWDQYAPHGKEVDCIYGDLVLKNRLITVVIANPIPQRHANVTVLEVGGSVIDFTANGHQSDQLSAFYPGGGESALQFREARVDGKAVVEHPGNSNTGRLSVRGESVELICQSTPQEKTALLEISYRLAENTPYLQITSTYRNPGTAPVKVNLHDRIRADRLFEWGSAPEKGCVWWYDKWFGQAYGIRANKLSVSLKLREGRKGALVRYLTDSDSTTLLETGDEYVLTRVLYPGENLIEVRTIEAELEGAKTREIRIEVKDAAGPVSGADITLAEHDEVFAWGRTGADGVLRCRVPEGNYLASVRSDSRGTKTAAIDTSQSTLYSIRLPLAGYVRGRITDSHGQPIPCKVQFRGVDRTPDPDFGPDSGEHAVKNLYYTEDGTFLLEIAPGTYDVVISHGPEYDAVFDKIEVKRGEDSLIAAELVRSVSTPGWISAEFHSHSSPSGDNTSSQYGRVLNLLCEHLEFAPCTEHNRISSYAPHLKRLGAEHLMATCSGIELTGKPSPVNHQNAFPLNEKPRRQDGGGPRTHDDPIVQIQRLALWDERSEKLVQQNHPNIVQILSDRDLNGVGDVGFKKMFGFMDVIEVHPPFKILEEPDSGSPHENRILNWLQLLNLGYRIPGVVNTDAHYNFHGSGWLRNYVKSSTDEPARIRTLDVVHASERGNLIMTNGPYLEVQLTASGKSATAGDEIAASNGQVVLHVRVQCPNWLDIDRVQILLNGRLEPDLNYRRREFPEKYRSETVKFDQKIPIQLEQDTHVIVVAAGEESALGLVMGPDHATDRPIAVSNPIYVDVDGDRFEPNGDLLGVSIPVDSKNDQ